MIFQIKSEGILNKKEYKKLALKWAPIHYQYIKLSTKTEKNVPLETKTDLLVPVNLDAFLNPCKCGHHFKEHHDLKSADSEGFCKPRFSNEIEKCDCKKFRPKYDTIKDAWDTKNIRKRLEKTPIRNLTPVVYYSIATTNSYFFILYSFYHANDEKHPNDMEGCLLILQRKEEKQELVGMMTVAHVVFPRYVYKDRLNFNKNRFFEFVSSEKKLNKKLKNDLKKRFNITGTQGVMEADDEEKSSRALTQQESQGHGLYALGENIWWPFRIGRKIKSIFGYLDFVVYYPGNKAKAHEINQLIRYKGMPHPTSLYYELIDIHDETNGLCHRIPSKGKQNSTFLENGKFHGDKASPPWLWVEEIDGSKLTFWDNPAELAERWFELKDPNKPFIDKDGYLKDPNKPFIDKDGYLKTMSQIEDAVNHTCEFNKSVGM